MQPSIFVNYFKATTAQLPECLIHWSVRDFCAIKLLELFFAVYDPVNHPGHYTSGGVECIDAIEASMTLEAFKGYLKGNCIKYLYRYEKKQNRSEDLKKCRWYLEKLISIVEECEVEAAITDCFANLYPDSATCFLAENSCADG